jgi:cytochrome c-type biogenesis protein CcmH
MRALPFGKIALLLAAFAAAFAIAYGIRERPGTERAGAAAQATGEVGAGALTLDGLEQQTRQRPDDATAWQTLGLAYFEAARFDDAVRAYEKASGLDAGKAILWSALGEARVMASKSDPMPPAAVANFERALALDAKDPRSRYFLAVKRDIGGDHAGAIDDWLKLLAETPTDAPWREDLVRTIEQVGRINKIAVAPRLATAGAKMAGQAPLPPVAARAIPGPSATDLRNAASIPLGQQREMAEGMVSRLEARLKGAPKNPDGWVMLMRSRVTLGEPDKAAAALREAVAANPEKAGELRQQAVVLGVK